MDLAYFFAGCNAGTHWFAKPICFEQFGVTMVMFLLWNGKFCVVVYLCICVAMFLRWCGDVFCVLVVFVWRCFCGGVLVVKVLFALMFLQVG